METSPGKQISEEDPGRSSQHGSYQLAGPTAWDHVFHMEPRRFQHQGKQPFKPLFHVHFVYKRSKHAHVEVKADLTNLQLTLIFNLFIYFFLETESLCVVLTILELTT